MSKMGLIAALMTAMWLTMAAVHNTSAEADAASAQDGDELQGLEIEHLQNSRDPAAWGAILERHAAAFQEDAPTTAAD